MIVLALEITIIVLIGLCIVVLIPLNKPEESYEQTTCPDCARKEGHSWHVIMHYHSIPYLCKCKKCGRYYYDNEDE